MEFVNDTNLGQGLGKMSILQNRVEEVEVKCLASPRT